MIASFETGLCEIIEKKLPANPVRAKDLVSITATVLDHFFQRTYGNPDGCSPDTTPSYWPFVRYLVFDRLRSTLGHGDSLLAGIKWNDGFLQDLVTEADHLTTMLPKNLTHQEWLFMTSVAYHMLLEDPRLMERGFVSDYGKYKLTSQTLKLGANGKDGYEALLMTWANQYGEKQKLN